LKDLEQAELEAQLDAQLKKKDPVQGKQEAELEKRSAKQAELEKRDSKKAELDSQRQAALNNFSEGCATVSSAMATKHELERAPAANDFGINLMAVDHASCSGNSCGHRRLCQLATASRSSWASPSHSGCGFLSRDLIAVVCAHNARHGQSGCFTD